jgi:hypothetical protein
MDISNSIAALATLAIFSFLYRDNPFYKFAEHLLVGISVGYFVVVAWVNTVVPKLVQPLLYDGQLLYLIPGVLGILMFMRLLPKGGYLSRIPIALIIGAGAGMTIPAYTQARIIAHMKASMVPLTSVDSVIIVIALSCTLIYFFFSKEQKGTYGALAKLGIYFLMVFFGATFGYTVMSRISLLIGRMQFLLGDWLGIIS